VTRSRLFLTAFLAGVALLGCKRVEENGNQQQK